MHDFYDNLQQFFSRQMTDRCRVTIGRKKKKKKEMREVDDTTKCKMIFARNYRISFIYHRTEYWLIRESDIKLMVVENTSSRFKITFTCYWYVVQTLISQIRVFFFLSFNMTDQTRVNKIATARKYISSSSRKTSKYAFLIICSSYIVHSFVSVFADPYLTDHYHYHYCSSIDLKIAIHYQAKPLVNPPHLNFRSVSSTI